MTAAALLDRSPRPSRGEIVRSLGNQDRRAPREYVDGYFDADVPSYDAGSGLGEPSAMYVSGTQMAEVTGQRVVQLPARLHVVTDAGTARSGGR